MGLLSSRPCLPDFSIPAGSTAGPPLLFLSCRKFRMVGAPGQAGGKAWSGWDGNHPSPRAPPGGPHTLARTRVGLKVPVLVLMVARQYSLHRALAVPAPEVTTSRVTLHSSRG